MSLQGEILSTTLASDVKCSILQSYWGSTELASSLEVESGTYEPFFAHYAHQCSLALLNGGHHVFARRHQDLSQIVAMFKDGLNRREIFEKLQTTLRGANAKFDDDTINGTIDLAARVFTMMNVGEVPHATTGSSILNWLDGSIRDLLAQHFNEPQILLDEPIKFEKVFNARNLERIGGMKIKWTSDLAEHLCMVDDDEKVAVFHHAAFLKLHRDSDVFPKGFIEETLRTLALLFPQSDDSVKRWVQKLPSSVDRSVRRCGHLRANVRQLDSFKFWHDRLVIMKGVFDDNEPRGLSQWWWDRRRRVQWYTFWVAVLVLLLTIFFGVVQSIEGALQAYKAYHPD